MMKNKVIKKKNRRIVQIFFDKKVTIFLFY